MCASLRHFPYRLKTSVLVLKDGMIAILCILVLISTYACSDRRSKDWISIVNAEPANDVVLPKGAVVDFQVKVTYNLISADSGTISLLVQDQKGVPVSKYPRVVRKINAGKGELILYRCVWIPTNVSRIDLFTPLFPEGETQTLIADYRIYDVASTSEPHDRIARPGQDIKVAQFPDLKLSLFLPAQKDTGNAAAHYLQALQHYSQDKGAPNLQGDAEQLSQRPLILNAMAKIFDGAHVKQCDFTIKHAPAPNVLNRTSADYTPLGILARTMAYSSDQRVAKQDFDTAQEIARCIVALGSHLRQSAYTAQQAFLGIRIEMLGAQQLLTVAQAGNNSDEQEKAIHLLRNLENTYSLSKAKTSLMMKDPQSWRPLPPLPKSARELLANLKDGEPIFRIHALRIIGTLYNKKYDNDPTLALSKDPNLLPFKASRPNDLQAIKAKVSELAAVDPDKRVREVAKLVLDILEKFANE